MSFDGLSVLSHCTSHNGGVAVLFSKDAKPTHYETEKVIKGRLLKVKAVDDNHSLY